MNELALKIIAENRDAHERGEDSAKRVDLGNCGLTEIPPELFELVWLDQLNFGLWVFVGDEYRKSENNGPVNRINSMPKQFGQLTNLQQLDLSRSQVSDLGPLASLTNLGIFAQRPEKEHSSRRISLKYLWNDWVIIYFPRGGEPPLSTIVVGPEKLDIWSSGDS